MAAQGGSLNFHWFLRFEGFTLRRSQVPAGVIQGYTPLLGPSYYRL